MAESHVIYKAEVQVGIKDKGFKAEAKKISDKVKSLGRDLNIKPGTVAPTKEMKALQAETRKAEKELERLLKKQESLRKAHMNSPEYKALAKDIQKAEQELDEMIAKQSAWAEMGLVGNSQFNALDDQIEKARVQLEALYAKQKQIAESGATDKEAQEWYSVGDAVNRARERVESLRASHGKMKGTGNVYSKIKSSVSKASAALKHAKKAATGAANAFRKFGGSVAKAGKRLLSFTMRGKGASKVLTSIKKGLLLGAGLKPLARLAMLGGGVWLAVRGVAQGMKNLTQYSSETNASVSMLWGSLITLKNALATAFAPVFNAIAPAINSLIQMITKAATAIAHFTAAFTGKSTVVVAKNVTKDYAASVGDAADATNEANKAAKEYQKTLLGFDQMNILNSEESSSGAGGSGGVGGGGGADVGDMFETVDVSNGAKSLADKIKESWEKADFTDLGKQLGDKMADMLDSIPWEKLKSTAYKFGKSVATGFNGLNDSALWTSIGKALGESVNTVVSGVSGFVENFDWKKAGKAWGNGVNTFFDTVDWKKLTSTVRTSVKGVCDTISSFLDTVDWEKIGDTFGDGLSDIFTDEDMWNGIGTTLGKSVNTAIKLIKSTVKSFKWEDAGKTLASGVNTFFDTVDWTDIGKTVSASVGGILDTITGFFNNVDWEQVGNDLVKVIKGVDWAGLIVKGIKAAGSIASAVLKLLKGAFQSAIDGISDWITSGKIWEDLLNIGKVTLDIGLNLIGEAWDLIKTVVKGVKKVTFELGGAILEKIEKAVSWVAEKLGFTEKNTPKTPESNPVQYQGHDWQGVDMSSSSPLKIKLTGELDGLDQSKLTVAQKTINGSKAKVTTQTDAIPDDKKSLTNFNATLQSHTQGKNFSTLIGGMSAILQSHKQGNKFSTAIGGMSATLQSHTQGKNFSNVIDKMKAKITSRDNALSDKEKKLGFTANITERINALSGKEKKLGFTANITERINALSDKEKVLGGFTAKLTAKLDAITGKTITGFTAEIADFKASRNSKGKVVALTKADGGLYRNGRWQPIAAAANGGAFNTGQMFIAREAGPELVGKIGGGTAVMNNDQIVASVSKGVYDAMLSAMSVSGGDRDVNIYLQGDAGRLFKVIQNKANEYINTTGQAPFPA